MLASHCYACHSKSAAAPQGGLLLDSRRESGEVETPALLIQPGDPDNSLLIRAIRHTDKKLKMPPGDPLSPEVVADFELWIREGASLPADAVSNRQEQPSLWSLQKPKLSALPDCPEPELGSQRYRSLRLEPPGSQESQPSAEADKRTLIRRATYDLTGLPPTADEVDQFLKMTITTGLRAPGRSTACFTALRRAVGTSLAGCGALFRFGERLGQHRAALSLVVHLSRLGDPRAKRRSALRQFVLYQLAADRLPNADPRHLAALGFLSLGREFPNSYPETVDDRIDAVTRGLLGLTVACARCHDHKYDPIPTKDYYSLYSIFSNIRQPKNCRCSGSPSGSRRSRRSTRNGSIVSKRSIRNTAPAGTPRWWPSSRRRQPSTWLRHATLRV